VAGERDPQVLVGHKPPYIRCSDEQLIAALTGDYRPEHVFGLSQDLALYDLYATPIRACDQQVQQCLDTFAVQAEDLPPWSPRPAGRRTSRCAPEMDLRDELYRISLKQLKKKAADLGFELVPKVPVEVVSRRITNETTYARAMVTAASA
jgi:transposase